MKQEITILRKHFPTLWKICLLYGICYLLFAYRNADGIGSGIFAFLSSILLLVVANLLQKDTEASEASIHVHITKASIFYYTAAVLLSIANCLTSSYFFIFFNHVGSFLLFCIATIQLFYDDKSWNFSKYTTVLFTFWIDILEVIPVPFKDFRATRTTREHKKMSPTTTYILIGIICGLPILLITTMLLASADQIFSGLVGNIFNFEWLFDTDWIATIFKHCMTLPVGFIFYTLLIYLVFAALCKNAIPVTTGTPKQFATTIAITIFTMVDIVYILFCVIQVLFLFAELPTDYDYAEYARQGFFELLFVALINFVLVLFCNKHFKRNIALKIVMTITCVCTYIMMLSSAYRMLLYIDAYLLTFLRIFVLWFLAMLAFLMAGSMISIYKETWNSFRYCLFIVTIFYSTFAFCNVDANIAKYNVSAFETVLTQNPETQPNLDDYLPSDYTISKSYAKELAHLKKNYHDILNDTNQEALDFYLSMKQHFYYYSFDGDFELAPHTKLYESKRHASIFAYKHYNFAEAICYKEIQKSK